MSPKNRATQPQGTLVSIAQIAPATPYTAEHLRQLVRNGKIDAQKLGRDWLTTYESVLSFIRTQQRRHELPAGSAQAVREEPHMNRSFALTKLLSVALFAMALIVVDTISTNSYLDTISAAPLPQHRLALNSGSNDDKFALTPRGPEVPTPQVLGTSTTENLPPLPTTAISQSDIQTLITQAVQKLLAQGLLSGPKGDKGETGLAPGFSGPNGMVQNGNGQTTSVIGGTPIVSYIPASSNGNYTGGSLAGFTNLSVQNLTAGPSTLTGNLTGTGESLSGSLNVSGQTTLATGTATSLTVSGPVTFNGSTTIAGLTVTTLNPGLALGSVAFQGAAGLSQDNANFFYDAVNHRLGIGTSTPTSTLLVQGIGATNPFVIASSTGAQLMTILPNGNVGIGTTSPAYSLDVNGGIRALSFLSGANTAVLGGSNLTAVGAIPVISASGIVGQDSHLSYISPTVNNPSMVSALPTSAIRESDLFGRYYLRNWQTQVAQISNAAGSNTPISVMLIGDSWVAGNTITDPLRNYLQSQFGNGGYGWSPAGNYDGAPGLSTSGTWTDTNASTAYGLDGYDSYSTDTVTPAQKDWHVIATGGTFFYVIQPGGGTFRWKVDSGSWTTVDTNGTLALGSFSTSGYTNSYHDYYIQVVTAGAANIKILGWNFSNPNQGAIVQRIGHSGATAGFYASSSTGSLWAAQMQALNPSVVFVSLGSNDMNAGVATSTYISNMVALVSTIRAALPNADVAFYTQTDSGLTPPIPLSGYLYPLEDYARANGVGFIDAYKRLGPYNGNALGLYGSNKHPSTSGGFAIAQMLESYLTDGISYQYGDQVIGSSVLSDSGYKIDIQQSGLNGTLRVEVSRAE